VREVTDFPGKDDGLDPVKNIANITSPVILQAMNFSVHLNDEMVELLNQTAREKGKTRNALIREAVGEWLARRHPGKWPAEVMSFHGIRGIKRFEADRKKLKPPRRPPFDAISA
jgi:Arc/MetJ-type ribon-helix-helix transcriptional regulator